MCSTYTWTHTHMPLVASPVNIHSLAFMLLALIYLFSSDPVITVTFSVSQVPN